MLQNARVTAFTVFELLREIQLGGGLKLHPPPSPRLGLKRIFSLPITAPYIGLIIETGVCPAEQIINCNSLMLYHNIINSSKDILVKQLIQEQRMQNHLL